MGVNRGTSWTAVAAVLLGCAAGLQAAQSAGTTRGTTRIWIDAEAPARLRPGACLHGPDEPAAERRRRAEAVAYVRALQAAQTAYFGRNARYAHVSELAGLGGVPRGFVLQHAAAGNSYMLSLKDQQDACGFTLYADHAGTIYAAAPLAGDDPAVGN
jgi:hypothetical protein